MNKQLKQIKDAGVVGAGGAGFPTYAKLDCSVKTLVINAAECEPLLNKDQMLMQHYTKPFIEGIKVAMSIIGANETFIGIKKKNSTSIEVLRKALKSETNIYISEMADVYPAGDEIELIYETTGKRVPIGGLPKEIDVVVSNVESIINVYNAINNKSLTHTMLTVHGEVKKPYTAMLPIGMSYAEAIELSEGATINDFVIIEGGPMMGSITTDLNTSITKISSALIILPKDSFLARYKTRTDEEILKIGKSACDQCSICTSMCPRYLMGYPVQPHLAMRTLLSSPTNDLKPTLDAQACCNCNLCSYWSCPEGLDPRQVCNLSKDSLKKYDLWQTPEQLQERTVDIHQMREYRQVPTKRLANKLGLYEYMQITPNYISDLVSTKKAIIPTQMHIGTPASPCVKVGDVVSIGDCIASVDEKSLGVSIHASISGKVVAVSDKAITIES